MAAPPATAASNCDERYHVLVEFAYKHLDFQIPELESVLVMHGVRLGSPDCQVVTLPNEERFQQELQQKHISARRPFIILSLPSDSKLIPKDDFEESSSDIASIVLSCTLVRSVLELWGMDETIPSCAKATEQFVKKHPLGQKLFQKQSHLSKSWKVTVHTLGSSYTREEQAEMRSHFQFLDFAGAVQMKDPSNEFVLIREVELDANGGALYPRHSHVDRTIIAENDKRLPLACYFGRSIGGPRSSKGRRGFEQYSLKRRAYLGPTSMDAELSFIMANLGQVRKGSMVFDPFVGTGSILLSCAIRGAFCVGTDIDIRVLRGRSDGENILSNFRQFGLPRPELIRSDNAIYHRHFRHHDAPLYDAIICDPPYGIRAGARQSGSRLANPRPVLDEHRHDHIAQTRPYPVSDVMSDLLDVAARTLVMGGRLVYVIPSFATDFDADSDLPRHECLKMVHICYQPLAAELGRRMVAMKKVSQYDPSKRSLYLQEIWKNGRESAKKVADIREKLIEAAKKKPRYEERKAIRKEKRKQHKEAKKRAKTQSEEGT